MTYRGQNARKSNFATEPVDQSLHVDVESHRRLRRGANAGDVEEDVADEQRLQLIGEGPLRVLA